MNPSSITSLCLLTALLAAFSAFRTKTNHLVPSIATFIFASVLGSLLVINSGTQSWQASPWLAVGPVPLSFCLDNLSTTFLALLALLAGASSLVSVGYLKHLNKTANVGLYWSAFFIFLSSMALVILSADAVTFLVFWEMMSLSSCLLVATEHRNHSVQKAALIYLGSTRIATGFLSAGFFWMHSIANSWRFEDWHFSPASVETNVIAALILIGFAIKAGVWPFHIWLPYAHPAAPATVSSLMSGVMIKIAIYGIIRTLIMGDLSSPVIGYIAVAAGTISAFWGILFALIQTDLKKTLAYSSVEHIGLILLAIGIAIIAKANGLLSIAAIALSAALFHAISHGVFKGLLFLSAGTVYSVTHTLQIGNLGGLIKRMPLTAVCFLLGCLAVCSLPPMNGFVGKWMIYQALITTTWSSNSPMLAAGALGIVCILSLVGGLALACFANTYSVSFLGGARSSSASSATESDPATSCAQICLSAVCVILGCFPAPVVNYFNSICDTALHTHTAHSGITVLSQLSTVSILIALITLFAFVYLLILKPSNVRQAVIWECGFGDVSPRAQVTADSFIQPIARIFNRILCYGMTFDIEGADRRHFPERIKVVPHTASIIERRVYEPLLTFISFLARCLLRMQSGSIHLYLTYFCVTLVALIFVGRYF